MLRVTILLRLWGAMIRLWFLLVRTRAGTFVVRIGIFSWVVLRRWERLGRVGRSLALENRSAWFSCLGLVE